MKTVNVAKLKNELSAYLGYVRKGEEVLVKDRNTPIARIVPLGSFEKEDGELLSLAAAGVVKLPTRGGLRRDWFKSLLRSTKVKVSAVEVIREERHER
jgi:prevent-host-death family protein